MKKLLLFSFLVSFYSSINAQIFIQDFSASTIVSDYTSATPNSGQFDAISSSGSSSTTSINNEALRFNRTGAASLYAYRNFSFTTNPTFVQLKFDFEVSNYQAGTQSPLFSVFVGSGFSSASFGTTSTYASRFGIAAQDNAGEFKVSSIDNIGGAPSSGAFSGKQTITFVVNNSGKDKNYTAPDGSAESVANGKMDVWVGLTKGIDEFSLKNTDAKGLISGFKIQATSASGTGIFDFDNIEMKDLEGSTVTPPTPTDDLPDTNPDYLTLKHPFIWTSYAERQEIVDNVNQYEWAKSYYNQLKSRVDAKKNVHKTNPSTTLSAIPSLPGVTADRSSHNEMLTSASESALLYFLTDNKDYAQYSADILSHYADRLALVDSSRYNGESVGIIFGSWWLESRAIYPKIAVTYDLLYNYVNNPANTVYDLSSNSTKKFDNNAAQTTVQKLAAIVFKSIGAPKSNHSVLAGNGALFNLLMIDDDATREKFFKRFFNEPNNERFDAYEWTLANFNQQNIWDETLGYSRASHTLVLQSLNVIDRYKPELDIINKNTRILDGYAFYENYFYPSGEVLRFGDTSTDDELLDGYQRIMKIAKQKNLSGYIEKTKQTLKFEYDKRGGNKPKVETESLEWSNPLLLLWGVNIEDNITATPPKMQPTQTVDHAGLIIQRNFNTTDVIQNGMMYYSGGATYVHTHSTGINLELYGKGHVLGAESGSGSYGSDEHEDYRVRLASHNTVIVNGSGLRGNNWDTKMSDVSLLASEPKANAEAISSDFLFSTQYIDDTYNNCQQQRTNSIIRTSATTGYYFDIFRSKGKVSDNYHDYIFHNIGDAVSLKYADNTVVPLSASTKYSQDVSAASVTGWKFFENVNSSTSTDKGIKATFELNTVNLFMNVSIPAGIDREYATALSPYTKAALDGYDKKKTPVLTMRKIGEAWNEPFVAIYEPSENQGGTVKSTTNIIENNKVVGVKVISEVNGATITDIIIANDVDGVSININSLDVNFEGRFGIVRLNVKDGKTKVSLYIGKGQQISFNGKSLNADADGKGLLEYTLDYEYEFKLDSNNFLVETIGESCTGKENGSIKINAVVNKNYTATINNTAYKFTNTTTIENLKPGNYEFCITVDGEVFKQCYQVAIEGGSSLSGKVSVSNRTADVSIEKGTAPFTVIKNGETILETYQTKFSLKIENGDELQIKSKSACQGVISKRIDLLENVQAYPNPSNGLFEVYIPAHINAVDAEVYNMQSQLISSKTYLVNGGTISLDISNKPSGIYLVKLNLEKPVFVKVVKK